MNLPVILISLITVTFIDAQEGVSCRTPNGIGGKCVNIKQCESLLALLTNQINNTGARNFLIQSTCSYDGQNLVVCCDLETRTSTTSSPTTFSPKSLPVTTQPSNNNQLLLPPYCGISNSSDGRIVGGVPAQLGQFPWIVALGFRNRINPSRPKWLCGGSLITYTHVLTAGHCVHRRSDLYLVRVGELDLYSDEDKAHPEDILITNVTLHKAYSVTFTNDIAILTLAHKPTVTGVWPICLPTIPLQSKDLPFVAGWGSISFRGPTSSILQVVQLPIVSQSICKQSFARFRQQTIDDRVLCAGYTEGKKSACQGDSGGPLMLSEKIDGDKNAYYAIGIVSYSFMCAEPDNPTVYTNVSSFLDWIKSNLT